MTDKHADFITYTLVPFMLFGSLSAIIWVIKTIYWILTILGYCFARQERCDTAQVESQGFAHARKNGVVTTAPDAVLLRLK